MKKKLATKWSNALRSGRYKQGTEFLRKKDKAQVVESFCCLGVLCEITGIKSEFQDGKIQYYRYFSKDGVPKAVSYPGSELQDSTGFIKSLDVSLAGLNDTGEEETGTGPLTFDEIADIIDIFYKEL